MAEIVISPLAKADLQEIADYISREKHSPGAAVRLIQRFRREIYSLRDFPESGAPLLPPGKARCPYRYLVCGNYLIFYHTDRTAVMVDCVLYGRRDYLALLFGDALTDEDE
ncbi:MAG: type II toxin-antitoxin system RelE/ParE family toxin [Oscillospiraceae bacterium]|nr:type II toxin-antitoxin system RelE/ParE family toxin [Oscillospiraceae bacterium]